MLGPFLVLSSYGLKAPKSRGLGGGNRHSPWQQSTLHSERTWVRSRLMSRWWEGGGGGSGGLGGVKRWMVGSV